MPKREETYPFLLRKSMFTFSKVFMALNFITPISFQRASIFLHSLKVPIISCFHPALQKFARSSEAQVWNFELSENSFIESKTLCVCVEKNEAGANTRTCGDVLRPWTVKKKFFFSKNIFEEIFQKITLFSNSFFLSSCKNFPHKIHKWAL